MRAIILVTILFGLICQADSQTYSRQEVGAGISAISNSSPTSAYQVYCCRALYSGPLVRYTWNLSPSLALEGGSAFHVNNENLFSTSQSGDLQMTAGVKVGWRGRRFGVFGEIKPGGDWYPNGIEELFPVHQFFNVGYFVLQQGGVFEWYLKKRWIWRADVRQMLTARFDHTIAQSSNERSFLAGAVPPRLLFSFSASYRLGELREEKESAPPAGRADIGFIFPLHIREHLENQDLRPDRGAGGWASVPVIHHISLDAAGFRLPEDDQTDSPQDGGPATEIFGGLKAGIRRDKMGYFGKFRPGMIRFDHGLAAEYQTGPSTFSVQSRPLRNLALDMGGVLEVYASRHTILRADASNVYIHYRGQTVASSSGGVYSPPLGKSSILFTFGAGWRF